MYKHYIPFLNDIVDIRYQHDLRRVPVVGTVTTERQKSIHLSANLKVFENPNLLDASASRLSNNARAHRNYVPEWAKKLQQQKGRVQECIVLRQQNERF